MAIRYSKLYSVHILKDGNCIHASVTRLTVTEKTTEHQIHDFVIEQFKQYNGEMHYFEIPLDMMEVCVDENRAANH